MRNYSRKKSTPGKVAYRTPSRFKTNRALSVRWEKAKAFGEDSHWKNKLEDKF